MEIQEREVVFRMKQNNAIRSLYRTNDATAQAIMQQYPPQWDMERVFRKAYQGYLAQEEETLQRAVPFSSEVTETVEYTPENHLSGRIRRFSGYAGIAAAMVGVFLLIAGTNSPHTPVDQIPDETDLTTATETTAEAVPETTFESTGESAFVPVFTEGFTAETTASTMESTDTETISTQTEAIMTEIPASGTAGSDTTETAAATTTETTSASTTETTPATQSHGQFIIEDPTNAAASYTIRYARESDVPVEKHEHTFEADGFTLTQRTEYNEEYDFHSTYYSLQDGNGQNYAVNQFQYDYFSTTCNPDSGELMKQYTIGGKFVILLYQEDPGALCRLIWDDGCHVCVMYSQYKDLANMELLLQSQTGEKIVVPEFESYFKMEEPTGSGTSGRIVYVLGNSDPVQERTHSFAADGFTLTDITEYNAGQPYHSTNYTLTDENGQQYLIMQEQYAYFAASYNPDAVPLTKSYAIGGKNVFLVYEDNLDSLCRLMWDDGCHICTVMSQYKDLAKMELLVQSQITE